ncbi:hypothetical protein [Streptomyces sp. NPDC002133]|uniref:hypothetical protein n=1 Tax=Streptomyces sp. NPDC002133 TaxID=3154409 RepID=UPI00332DDB10
MLGLTFQPNPIVPSAVTFSMVPGPKFATTGLMPSSVCNPMIREFMVVQPVRPSSGHRTYPATLS